MTTHPPTIDDRASTLRDAPAVRTEDLGYSMVVVAHGVVTMHTLPASGPVTIGRARENVVQIIDASVSRFQARIDLEPGSAPMIRDLGSSNGTRIGGEMLTTGAPVKAPVGEAMHVGTVTVMLHPQLGVPAERIAAKAALIARGEADPRPAGPMIVRSESMRKLQQTVARVADSGIPVLILGDTGVGKEVLAEQVHQRSSRHSKGFVRLNCAALSESLLESELFGHERGAFTGAHRSKPGLLEAAEGGTVFLDEIGELPLAMQAKLLRVLEEKQIWRVGAVEPRKIDVRFVAATNRNLEADVAAGAFRQDLYFRLSGISLVVPPLRERVEEIEPLASQFVVQVAKDQGRDHDGTLPPAVLERLRAHPWPGNIRELRNAVERAVLLAADGPLAPEHFAIGASGGNGDGTSDGSPAGAHIDPVLIPTASGDTLPPAEAETDESLSLGDRLRAHVQEVEREHILDALNRCGGNQTRAAKELGISRRTLISRLEAYNIPRPLKDRRS